jgi:hypothetical protein
MINILPIGKTLEVFLIFAIKAKGVCLEIRISVVYVFAFDGNSYPLGK